MRKKEGQMKVRNLGKRGWHKIVKTAERNVQVNLLNQDSKGLQVNLSMEKKKNANESVEYRQKRRTKQCQYQK